MPIDRTVFDASVDDSGSGTSGTVINKAWLEAAILDPVDNAIVGGIGVSVYHNTQQSIPSAAYTALLFNTESFDTDDFHSTVTNTDRLTVPSGKAGVYLITAYVYFAFNTMGYRSIAITKNINATSYWHALPMSGTIPTILQATTTLSLVADDYISVLAYQSSGAALNTGHTIASSRNWVSMLKMG